MLKTVSLITLSIFLYSFSAVAQEITVPLERNYILQKFTQQQQSKPRPLFKHSPDTLELPFFDDFTETKIYPNHAYWADELTFVNHSMPKIPPSYNAATFDGLNRNGAPYDVTANLIKGLRTDSLTSKYINLSNLKEADSVYLSFFYQAGGYADIPEDYDSITVEFRPDSVWTGSNWSKNSWIRVWSAGGSEDRSFKQKIIKIAADTAYNYFHNTFQFRFVTYGNRTGNLDHWHVDYVYLNQGRNRADTFFNDVAIYRPSQSILKDYTAMPYDHFIVDMAQNMASLINIYTKNNDNALRQVTFGYSITDPATQFELANTFPISETQNISPLKDTIYKQSLQVFSNFPSVRDTVKMQVKTGVYSSTETNIRTKQNDTATHEQIFANYYAYDDGIAEAGYGLINAKAGKVAMRYNVLKGDTLQGIMIYFNRSEIDVSVRYFNLTIWNKLSPINVISNSDEVLLVKEFIQPIYLNNIGGFAYFPFDTPVFIPKGEIFVGWTQNTEYILNVGLDYDYRHFVPIRNPQLFYNIEGRWRASDIVGGVPMIRPVIGKKYVPVNIEKKNVNQQLKVYPNPANQNITVELPTAGNNTIRIYNMQGKETAVYFFTGQTFTIPVNTFANGMYFLQVDNLNGMQLTEKFLIKH